MLPDSDVMEICPSLCTHPQLPVPLTATEFKLLEFLMTRPGTVFSRDQLLDAVWGHGRAVTARTVDVYILRLRKKIEAWPGTPSYIRSVRGFGYSFPFHPRRSFIPDGFGRAVDAARSIAPFR
jgi:DNA-binding response OmpR family regulator